jgi:hypothetical protein
MLERYDFERLTAGAMGWLWCDPVRLTAPHPIPADQIRMGWYLVCTFVDVVDGEDRWYLRIVDPCEHPEAGDMVCDPYRFQGYPYVRLRPPPSLEPGEV